MCLRNILRFTLAAACSRNREVESAPAPAHRIPKTGSIKVSKRCGGSFPAAIYLVERNAAHAAMRARTAMAGGVVPQGEAQKLTPMPNSPFCARWCKAGVWRPPLGRGQGRWRRSADRARLGAPLQRRGGRTLILSAEDDVDESQTRHRAARGLFPLNHRCRPAT